MKQADREIFKKMIHYCDMISAMIDRFGADFDAFRKDDAYQMATGMCIIQIGELVNRLSPEAMAETMQIPWRLMRAMRNIYAHDYERTKALTIWQTITEDIPSLRAQLQDIIEKAADTNE